MIVILSEAVRSARSQVIADFLSNGKLQSYTAPRPASGEALTTQVLLGSCALSNPAGVVTAGTLSFSPVSDEVSALGNGDIAWVRGVDSLGNWVLDMDAGLAGSGAAVEFDSLVVRTGGTIKILSGSLTEGNV